MLVPKVWRGQPGQYFCISTKTHSGNWRDHFFPRSKLRDVKAFVEDNLDRDIYWCPHGFDQPRRRKDYAVLPKLLWADIDEVEPYGMTPLPTIVWESSPGRYAGLWRTKEPVNEDLNRRLTYFIGADHGGWDITQVLRVPGTLNYKYESPPTVKLLWDDGPIYDLEELERVIPQDESTDPQVGEAHQVYQRYHDSLTAWARRTLIHGKPKVGKRSEILWRLNQECLEAGMTTDEAFQLLVVSPWNKFSGRRKGAEQLRRELNKALARKMEAQPVAPPSNKRRAQEQFETAREEYLFLQTPLEDVKEEQIDWLWYPYLARREMTILEGDPGLGKSYLAQMVGAAFVDGKALPVVKTQRPHQGTVVYFDMENSAGTVTKRRLTDNGCHNLVSYYQEEHPFTIDDDEALDAIYDALKRLKPSLVVFDTINTYIGKADTYKASETQQALSQFLAIAKEFNCSVLVLRHLTKSTKEKALYRGQGSISFTGLARVVMTVGQHPDDDDIRVMAVTKLNVTRKPPAITFTIRALPDTLKLQDRSEFLWGDFVDLTSDEILTISTAAGDRESRKEDVGAFLKNILGDGAIPLKEIIRMAEARGIGMKAVRREADTLGIIRHSTGFGKTKLAMWKLPSCDSKLVVPD